MFVEDVITFIKQSVSFAFYGNDFPKADKGNCGFVRVDGGTTPHLYIVGLKSPSIQVVIRHEKGNEAERLSKEIWNLFHGKEHYRIGKAQVKLSYCDQSEPIYIGMDEKGRSIYSINVSCKVIE